MNMTGTEVMNAQDLMVFRSAPMKIMARGTSASMMHQNRRRNGLGSSPSLRPIVDVEAMVKAAPSSVVARKSRELMQKATMNTGPTGRERMTSMMARVSLPAASIPTISTTPVI